MSGSILYGRHGMTRGHRRGIHIASGYLFEFRNGFEFFGFIQLFVHTSKDIGRDGRFGNVAQNGGGRGSVRGSGTPPLLDCDRTFTSFARIDFELRSLLMLEDSFENMLKGGF